jgi:hypothetical protein
VLDLALNTARGTPWENACRRRHFGMHMDGRSRGAGGRWLGCRVPECLHRRRPAAARTVMGMTASSAAGKCSLNQARPNGDMRCSLSVRSNPLQKLVRTNSIYSRDLDRASGLNQLQFIRYELRQFVSFPPTKLSSCCWISSRHIHSSSFRVLPMGLYFVGVTMNQASSAHGTLVLALP